MGWETSKNQVRGLLSTEGCQESRRLESGSADSPRNHQEPPLMVQLLVALGKALGKSLLGCAFVCVFQKALETTPQFCKPQCLESSQQSLQVRAQLKCLNTPVGKQTLGGVGKALVFITSYSFLCKLHVFCLFVLFGGSGF